MYLSTLFLSNLENGITHAISECNNEFVKRFGDMEDYISEFFVKNSSDNTLLINSHGDELMALWDVFKDFKDEVESNNFPIIDAMNNVREIRHSI